ncbi:hypothetical protein EV361DRAFT_920447 [Lentinula raphanica]|uniref:Uncharacterized protein n=1 Tax=Lentinula raphanica TaxID=153919 RepID=A0AA38PAY8_9AGAR|nr:hypothetical protein C8R42DRAFT_71075 [Lentinula raphanica]KAJ3769752.1 hypothetical protein FB446DRAFT_201035 [Lentinula raphanica]KAJ3819760.1 hypothetical protein F5880DRAFT_1049003 [Lentinula raphanica]KAJ3839574.1 hypothetical protein F5878DRAFT_615891 [Lentinula raphanica]KAJ3969509.1 hypothetical protein EV361DRAFT_920447 [Lentinula raphanica]
MSTRTANSGSHPSPLPSHFDPFATHPFTSYSSVSPASQPSQSASKSQSQPLTATQPPHTHTHHPSPTRPMAPPRSKGVFVPFRQGAASPDLHDILKKKPQPTKINSAKQS